MKKKLLIALAFSALLLDLCLLFSPFVVVLLTGDFAHLFWLVFTVPASYIVLALMMCRVDRDKHPSHYRMEL